MSSSDQELQGRVDRPDGPEIVRGLLNWPDGRVRFWALAQADRVLPKREFAAILRKAADDKDDAVSSEAIARLAVVDQGFLRRRAKSLSERLNTDIRSGQKVFAMWTLCRIGSTDSIASIEELRSKEPSWTKLARVADVAVRYLTEGGDRILSDIRQQADDDHLEELCTVAWFVMANDKAREALEQCAYGAPDDRWKRECAYGLQRLSES
jgi:hypothetical protein